MYKEGKTITPALQKKIVKEMIEDNLALINTGVFFIDGKYYVLNLECKEVKQ